MDLFIVSEGECGNYVGLTNSFPIWDLWCLLMLISLFSWIIKPWDNILSENALDMQILEATYVLILKSNY